jgi:endonuclease/exonuclease/phosphatase (EEP) superfamily protein YafD
LVSVHLDHQQDARRLKQAETLVKELSATKEPLVLAGDFNDVPQSPVMKVFGAALTMVEKGGEKLTCPAAGPKVEIDHFFVRGFKAVSPVTVLPEAVASDHRPLVVTVRMGE